MKTFHVLPTFLFLILTGPLLQTGLHHKPAGIPDADSQVNQPVEPPMRAPNKRLDRDQVKQEAQQLKELADSVPAGIDQVTNGQLPKDFLDNLKQIERLAKHLRSEVSP